MSEELQTLLEASRRMVETRDLVIADLKRENRELREALHGRPDPEWDGSRTMEVAT